MPLARIDPTPARQSIVSVLVMVTCPKPPGSRQSISPPAAVFEMAPPKVLQGAVRLQGFTSSPTPETQVRVACACPTAENTSTMHDIASKWNLNRKPFITTLLLNRLNSRAEITRKSMPHTRALAY